MEWVDYLKKAIDYIEEHLLDDISTSDVCLNIPISSFYLQKAFNIYTGYSINEYIHNRRLYQAALEVYSSNSKIIDIAYKYGYETPEAFTKAFKRFHGATPFEIKSKKKTIKLFLPLVVKINIVGGEMMDYKIEKEDKIKFIGFKKTINANEGYKECPKFWDEIGEKYFSKLNDDSRISKIIKDNNIGEFALCKENNNNTFDYWICGKYNGKETAKELEFIEVEASLWAKFRCVGPLPGALQTVNTKIWEEWIINNKEYELNLGCDIEWYSDGDTLSDKYESAIWLPIKEK